MNVLDILEKVRDTRNEVELLLNENARAKIVKNEIDSFIKNRSELMEEFLGANDEGRGEILLRLSTEERKHLLASLNRILEQAEKLCSALVKISFQTADKKPEKLFNETDLFSIVLDIMN